MIVLRHYRDLLGQRWRLLCLATLCTGLGVLLGALTTPPVYQATALVEVDVPVTNTNAAITVTGVAYTQARLATASSVLKTVAAKYHGLSEASLRSQVTAVPVANSALIQITVRDSAPSRASSLATDIANTLVAQQVALVVQTNLAAQQAVRDDIDLTGAAIQTADLDLARLQAANASPGQIAAKRAELDSLSARHDALQSSLSAIQQDQADNAQFTHVAQRADSNPTPIRAISVTTVALGALFGFMLGLVALVLYDRWAGQIRSVEQLERLLELPVLAAISAPPLAPEAHIGSVQALSNPEAYQDLEIALTYLSIEHPVRTVALTSVEREGAKQAVAAGMASLFARRGKKTLLVQADLGDPGRATAASDGSPGLSEAIVAYQSPGTPIDAISAYFLTSDASAPNPLLILQAGAPPPHPDQLLATPAAGRAFTGITATDAEAIIVVAPPALGPVAPTQICAHADGVLLVLPLGVVNWKNALEARRRLLSAGARLLGCVAIPG
jgi:capsular polysaccharide biosynthesis protein